MKILNIKCYTTPIKVMAYNLPFIYTYTKIFYLFLNGGIIMTTKGKFVRVKIRAFETLYTGDIYITDIKSRVSDIINDNRMFIELVNATEEGKIDDIEIGYIALSKSIIESVSVVEENSKKEVQPHYGYEINKEEKNSFQHTITNKK